jgi:hypothetical protein
MAEARGGPKPNRMGDLMEGYTAEALAAQLNDPGCDHVGPYEKCGDNENAIETLLYEHGLVIDDNGWAQPFGNAGEVQRP